MIIRYLVALTFCFNSFNSFSQTHEMLIKTTYGSMRFMLYDDTPKHRDAFIEQATRGDFDSTLFFRVIEGFIIQGGSKDSKNAAFGKSIGKGNSKMTVDDEILENHICKKGALCAPRQPDDKNPFKQSDVSQFFIIQGRKYTKGQLDTMEFAVNRPIKNKIISEVYTPEIKEKLKRLKDEKRIEEAQELANSIRNSIDMKYELALGKLVFNDVLKEAYSTVGGAPELDGEYTVYGEIIDGFDVIDKIASLKTDSNDRPVKDVRISVKILK